MQEDVIDLIAKLTLRVDSLRLLQTALDHANLELALDVENLAGQNA
jgi:hypothetical protein